MRRPHSLTLLALTALTPVLLTTASLASAPAGEQPAMSHDAGPQPLSDDELSGLRGGFTTPGGVTFGFGAVIRSYVDNKLALQTQLTWTPQGVVTEQVRGDAPGLTDLASAVTTLINNGINLSAITGAPGNSSSGTGSSGGAAGAAGAGDTGSAAAGPATGGAGNLGIPTAGAATGGAGDAGAPTATGGAGNASIPAAPVTSSAGNAGTSGATTVTDSIGAIGNTPVAGGTIGGVALVDASGATALIHNVTASQIQSFIVNSANNRNLRQDIELNLYLPELAAMQAASSVQQRASQMTYDLNTSLVGSLR